jgi:hypothetical protein
MANGSGGISFGSQSSPNVGFSFGSQSSPNVGFSWTQSTPVALNITKPVAWVGILAHSSYHEIQEIPMNGKITTILLASLGNCSKLDIPNTAETFNLMIRNGLDTSPFEILKQLNDIVKIKLSKDEEAEGFRISPEKLRNYNKWIHDPGMISKNRDVYYEKWYDFRYGFTINGFVKLYIE